MTLARGAVLREAIDSRRSVYFIEYGLASLVTGHPAPAVVATVGREGAVGGPTPLLGGGIAFGRYEMLISGAALALEAPCFHNALRQDPKVHSLCEAYCQTFFAQVLQNIACRDSHTAEQRYARWLLMCDDQTEYDAFELAEESLAAMLGLPQVVADAVASTLQRAGLIRLREGLVTILDRRKLETAACVCYGTLHDHYKGLLARAWA